VIKVLVLVDLLVGLVLVFWSVLVSWLVPLVQFVFCLKAEA
jgi:hypothetical protein